MNLMLAVNDENLENYIIENFKDINVVEIVRLKKDLIPKVVDKNPDLLLISAALPGEDNISDIILKLTSKSISKLRIAYLYGADDNNRKSFVNFLISRGICDYFIGSELTPESISELFFNPKSREDVKEDILTSSVNVTPSGIEIETKPSFQIIKNYIKELSDDEKKELGLVAEEKIIEEIIYQDKVLGTIVIGVAGSSSGIGSTFTAITIAKYIKQYDKKLKVAILEVNNSKDFNSLNIEYSSDPLEGSFVHEDISFYTATTSLTHLISLNEYQYIILDIGKLKSVVNNKIIKHEHYNEFLRSNLAILVAGSQPWQSKDIYTCLYDENGDSKESYNWKLLFNFTNGKRFKKFCKDIDWQCYNLPIAEELFELQEQTISVLLELLSSILPKSKKQRGKKGWLFFKK